MFSRNKNNFKYEFKITFNKIDWGLNMPINIKKSC
jgi:hypothetical protein